MEMANCVNPDQTEELGPQSFLFRINMIVVAQCNCLYHNSLKGFFEILFKYVVI